MAWPVSSYWIDAGDRILRVNDAFVAFARANGAPELGPQRVAGASLWRFVQGSQVREIYLRIFERVRESDAPILLPFRCDSPDRRRFMRMVISHVRGGELQLDAVMEREEPRVPVKLLETREPGPGEALELCSLCKRIYIPADDEWLEVEDAAVRLGLLEEDTPPLHHVACGDCRVAVELLARPA